MACLGLALAIPAGFMLVGGYAESRPFALEKAAGTPTRPALAAVYWSGDMGMRVGTGRAIVDRLLTQGIPVLTVSSPMLFGRARDSAFVDHAVARSLRAALARSGAGKLTVIGTSFGADILGSGLGRAPEDLRRRIASVVLVVPSLDVYFHANPTGVFYRGPVASDPQHSIPLLRGLPVTCIYGTEEADSLCRAPVMRGARTIPIADGHLMLSSRAMLAETVLRAVEHPPLPMPKVRS